MRLLSQMDFWRLLLPCDHPEYSQFPYDDLTMRGFEDPFGC